MTKVLVIFPSVALYGMERGVIETFDLLRPEVEPTFLISQTPRRLGLPVYSEIVKRKLPHVFLSDTLGWERLGKPKSLRQAWRMFVAFIRANLDALRYIPAYDVLYLPAPLPVINSFLATTYCRLTGKRVFYHFHDLFTTRSKRLRVIGKLVTDLVHNTSLGMMAVLHANPYLNGNSNHVIPIPVRSESNGDKPALRNRNRDSSKNILFLGQVSAHKGVDLLLDAFKSIANSHNDAVLNIVGGCDDPKLRERLSAATRDNPSKIIYWGYREDVKPFLERAYVYVQPSPPSRFHESFGIGLVEAMSAGVPSICFRSGAFEEIMVHESTGLICNEENAATLAESIDRLLSDEDLRDRCGANSLERYANNYSNQLVRTRWFQSLGIEF